MAEEDAEQAFFQAQAMDAEYDPAGPAQEVTELSGSEEDYDPSHTLHEEYSVSIAELNQNDTTAEPNDPTSATQFNAQGPDQPNEDDASKIQDPAQTSQPPSRPDSQTSVFEPPSTMHLQPNTKTIGGFVVEDDDDEEEGQDGNNDDDKEEAEYEPPGVLETIEHGHISASAPDRPFSENNANETVSTSGVSIQPPVPDMASSKDVFNNAVPLPSASVPLSTGHNLYSEMVQQVGESTDSNAPTPVPLAAASRNRLPHDRVGLLEDRIKEDPRGDITAWLELIAEHRSRNRPDNAREVFERFFKVFPSAVSNHLTSIRVVQLRTRLTWIHRLSNGWHMSTWNRRIASCNALNRSLTVHC